MHYDVSAFRDFYYRTTMGRSVQRRIRESISELWPDIRGDVLVGYGFAAPFLRPYLPNFESVINLMPEAQGVMVWPPNEKNHSVLCDETHWPLGANTVDCAILAHSLENTRYYSEVLTELYRVLSPVGRALILLPNRNSIWARNENTPFGIGHPYSLIQAERLLTEHDLIPVRHLGALYAPPSERRFMRKSEAMFEWSFGFRKIAALGGVLIVEVHKQTPPRMIRKVKREPIFAMPDLKPVNARTR